MPACEKCWRDSRSCPEGTYSELVAERNCTPEEQAGIDARQCYFCKRMTVHQHCGICMYCTESP